MEAMMGTGPYQGTSTSREDHLKEIAMAFMRLCAQHGGGDNSERPQGALQQDPYARASVAAMPRPRPIHPAMVRHLQPEPALQPAMPRDSRIFRKPVMKRKVLRRMPDGELQVTDESVTSETESSSPSDPEYRELSQRRDHLEEEEEEKSEGECEPNSSPESETSCSCGTSGDSQSQCSQREIRSHSSASYEQDLILTGYPKSFILPKLDQISRNRMKTDRVARYLEHKHDWESLRLPGEDHRKGVRWSIREQMLYKSQYPPRAQHVYIPNNYLVPTEKKRSALRWGIRCDLANGVMPRNAYSS